MKSVLGVLNDAYSRKTTKHGTTSLNAKAESQKKETLRLIHKYGTTDLYQVEQIEKFWKLMWGNNNVYLRPHNGKKCVFCGELLRGSQVLYCSISCKDKERNKHRLMESANSGVLKGDREC
jgi:Methionyl-tRNA synthetase